MDYSFIKLSKTQSSENQAISQINYADCIRLATDEIYLQVSNNNDGIAFDNDYSVFVVDCNNTELLDITSSIAIFEFLDANGVNQIAFEIYKISNDFGFTPVKLKFVKTTGSDIWYSNELLITDEAIEETTRFEYKNEGDNFIQSIRLNCFYDRLDNETEIKDYYQITRGNTISTRALFKELTFYKFGTIIPFIFRRINMLLISDVIYIDGLRMTNKTNVKGSERIGFSNLSEAEFSCFINSNDSYTTIPQIFEPLQLVYKLPLGTYNSETIPAVINGNFNRSITLGSGFLNLYNSSDTLISSFDETEVTIIANTFSCDNSAATLSNGTYYVQISNGLFISNTETFEGISNKTDWTFEITNALFLTIIDYITNSSTTTQANIDINFTIENGTPINVVIQVSSDGISFTDQETRLNASPLTSVLIDYPLGGETFVRLKATDLGVDYFSNIINIGLV